MYPSVERSPYKRANYSILRKASTNFVSNRRMQVVMMAQASGVDREYTKLMDEAVQENRIITIEEKQTRKNAGYAILAITLIGLAVYPPYREMYGAWSLGINSGIGVWRTGNQGL